MHFHHSKRCEYNLRLWGDSFVFHDYEKSILCLKVTEVKHTLQTKRGITALSLHANA